MVAATRSPEKMSYEDFLVFEAESEEKHEWVDGVVYAMSRGTPEHGRLAMKFAMRALGDIDDCEAFSSDTPIFIEAENHHTYADASIVCIEMQTKKVLDRNGKSIGEAVTNPAVVVEVLSSSTERYDRDAKFEAYRRLASLEQYVLVWQDERRIEVRTKDGDQWRAVVGGTGETVRVHGRDVAVDAIYESRLRSKSR